MKEVFKVVTITLRVKEVSIISQVQGNEIIQKVWWIVYRVWIDSLILRLQEKYFFSRKAYQHLHNLFSFLFSFLSFSFHSSLSCDLISKWIGEKSISQIIHPLSPSLLLPAIFSFQFSPLDSILPLHLNFVSFLPLSPFSSLSLVREFLHLQSFFLPSFPSRIFLLVHSTNSFFTFLFCLQKPGKPAPLVHWYRNNELIDDSYYPILQSSTATIKDNGGSSSINTSSSSSVISLGTITTNQMNDRGGSLSVEETVNQLTLVNISRKDVNTNYTCVSSNSPLSPPIKKTVFLESSGKSILLLPGLFTFILLFLSSILWHEKGRSGGKKRKDLKRSLPSFWRNTFLQICDTSKGRKFWDFFSLFSIQGMDSHALKILLFLLFEWAETKFSLI